LPLRAAYCRRVRATTQPFDRVPDLNLGLGLYPLRPISDPFPQETDPQLSQICIVLQGPIAYVAIAFTNTE
jgi:hypothetical protein